MILDSSALLAILNAEPEAEAFAHAIEDAPVVRISASTLLEAAIVVDMQGAPALGRNFDRLIAETGTVVEPFTAAQADIARRAFAAFGRGTGHPARLNFGDCFAYALARETGEPLLYKGRDFVETDVKPAIDPDPPGRD
jgi:ribonuclease VapC